MKGELESNMKKKKKKTKIDGFTALGSATGTELWDFGELVGGAEQATTAKSWRIGYPAAALSAFSKPQI